MPRVLFVDDEPYVLKALRRVFMDDDLEIDTAENGPSALTYLQDHPVDLILSDHNMPEMTGVEFLRRCREIQPGAIRMLITGRGEMDIVLQAINQGHVYKFFHKPWDDDQLRVSVLRALEFRAAQEEVRRQQAELARHQAFNQTMITVSHYINNFNCALTMSLESLTEAVKSGRVTGLSPEHQTLVRESLRAAEKVTAVLRILNRLEEIKIVDYDFSCQMIDIETEVKEAVKRIEEAR
ncbi:MAG: response regulator [Candidatus Zixiibacteriota bacterium]|nr:MAG: response regulator [candidate division Zixibacteria bacterium]